MHFCHIFIHDSKKVSIVGQITKINKQSTHINYVFDDGTGSIEVKKWFENGSMDGEEESGSLSDSSSMLRYDHDFVH